MVTWSACVALAALQAANSQAQSQAQVTQLHDVRSLLEIDSPNELWFDLSPVAGVVRY